MSALALTFDDGPDPVWTPRLLDLLGRLAARATFFPITPRAAAHPQIIGRMRDEGHAIGLHCGDHVRHTERDAAWLTHDTQAALATLSRLGVEPVFWRPPWGATAPWTVTVARQFGLHLIGWTVDTHDWRGDSAEQMLDATRASLTAGAVVLAHDGIGPGARRDTAAATLTYVERVAELADRRGLALEALQLGAPA